MYIYVAYFIHNYAYIVNEYDSKVLLKVWYINMSDI